MYCGTSGWSYQWWCKGFYTTNTPNFKQYVNNFNIVEINNTFYKLPSKGTVNKWYENSPENFRFIVKFSKYNTHNKKLIDFDKEYENFWNVIKNLKEKCIGILIQLPPNFKNTNKKSKIDNLTPFERLKNIDKNTYNIPLFIEFRDKSWYCDEIYKFFESSLSLKLVRIHCQNYFETLNSGFYPPLNITCDYVRLHGTGNDAYTGSYTNEDLELVTCMHNIIIFNNTDSLNFLSIPHAILNAKTINSYLKI